MNCSSCGRGVQPGTNFCPDCGAPVALRCPACGQAAEAGARFCAACGNALVAGGPGRAREDGSGELRGERRHITVLFCDLVDSTSLSTRLDPEDLREVLGAYQGAASAVVTRFEGHVAQFLGDGLLVYLGFPRAHEDDAERAVRAGLAIVAAIRALNPRLEREFGVTLSARVGIHSGPVVVGEIGDAERREMLALGDTTNLAARLQQEAPPDGVVLSDATLRLTQGLFITEALGPREIRGFGQPMESYLVLRTSGVRSRLDLAGAGGLSPLVGREQELAILLSRWQQVLEGRGQVVLISGDAGIGKSRLVRELRQRVAGTPHTWLECSASPYTHHSALYPVIELQARALELSPDEPVDSKLAKLEGSIARAKLPVAEYLPLFADLHSLPLPEGLAPPDLSPAARKQKLLGGVTEVLLQLGRQQPVLLLFEDLHWADASTFELLATIVEQIPTDRVFALFTFRSGFAPAWPARAHVMPMQLARLNQGELTELVQKVTGADRMPPSWIAEIVARTDGVPLFAEELTRAAVGSMRGKGGRPRRAEIPATLRDSLMARLDQLGEAKDLAQLCATLGREFSFELLQAVSPLDSLTLERQLARLVQSELIYCRGRPPRATYQFKHALIQEEAHASLLRRVQRSHHQRIGEALESAFPDRAEAQPELLAHHFSEAGLAAKALPYWLKAGRRAIERSANVEAVQQLDRGLALLPQLPDGPQRDRLELVLQGIRGRALAATRGRAAEEVRQAFARARELCEVLGDAPETFPMIFGLWLFHMSRADRKATLELAPELMRLALKTGDPGMRLEAELACGYTRFWQGEFDAARRHLGQTLSLYDPEQHASHVFVFGQDPSVAALAFEAWSLWLLGRQDSAARAGERALASAERSRHAFTLAGALWQMAVLFHELGETEACHALADRAVAIGTEQHFATQAAAGRIMRGAAQVRRGELADGLAQTREGVEAFRASGGVVAVPYQLSVLAGALLHAERADEGLAVIDEALLLARNNLDSYYEPELVRVRGELLRVRGDAAAAEACCIEALGLAREQGARTLELRAATSLARLWSARGERERARELLFRLHRSFEEGEKRLDLREAAALLESLG